MDHKLLSFFLRLNSESLDCSKSRFCGVSSTIDFFLSSLSPTLESSEDKSYGKIDPIAVSADIFKIPGMYEILFKQQYQNHYILSYLPGIDSLYLTLAVSFEFASGESSIKDEELFRLFSDFDAEETSDSNESTSFLEVFRSMLLIFGTISNIISARFCKVVAISATLFCIDDNFSLVKIALISSILLSCFPTFSFQYFHFSVRLSTLSTS